jgi:peptidoglycan/xylan/chitin deacetylase (PgdA/CDA1 family)
MKFYWVKTHWLIKKWFSNYVWDLPNREKIVYLTFDDGPTPEITAWTLEALEKYDFKATFFCIGNNIQKNPTLFQKIIDSGHAVANHTFNHLNGWETNNQKYLENISLCEVEIAPFKHHSSKLFRPPYGKIGRKQANEIRNRGYKIIMWDVLSADFDTTIPPEKCLENVITNVQSGSVIVFHDSVKAFKNLSYTLPKVLDFLDKNGFQCKTIA